MNRQDGFTLVELLVAMVLGMVITLAGLQALDSFTTASATVTARADNTQRARLSMDLLTRELRSQVCKGPGDPSVLAGEPNSVSFITDLSDGSVAPEKRTIGYDAAERRLTERRYAGTRNATGVLSFSNVAAAGTGLEDVGAIGATPIFGFYAYDKSVPARPTVALATPLSDVDRARVARIVVSFRVGPATADGNAESSASLQEDVFVRSVDPSDPTPVPLCA